MKYESPQSVESFESELTAALSQARARAEAGRPPCRACEHLATMAPGVEKEAVSDAMAGTIGVNRLADIFRQHSVPVGRRAIETHRAHLRETQ